MKWKQIRSWYMSPFQIGSLEDFQEDFWEDFFSIELGPRALSQHSTGTCGITNRKVRG